MKNLIEWLIRKIYRIKVSVEFKEKKMTEEEIILECLEGRR